MLLTTTYVALGGAIGAALRFLMGIAILRFTGPGFPVAILTANVIGSFLIGFLVVLLGQRFTGSPMLSPFLITGVLGGFTTFSAFSLEALTLFERGQFGQTALYILLSVGLSLGAILVSVWLARGIFG